MGGKDGKTDLRSNVIEGASGAESAQINHDLPIETQSGRQFLAQLRERLAAAAKAAGLPTGLTPNFFQFERSLSTPNEALVVRIETIFFKYDIKLRDYIDLLKFEETAKTLPPEEKAKLFLLYVYHFIEKLILRGTQNALARKTAENDKSVRFTDSESENTSDVTSEAGSMDESAKKIMDIVLSSWQGEGLLIDLQAILPNLHSSIRGILSFPTPATDIYWQIQSSF